MNKGTISFLLLLLSGMSNILFAQIPSNWQVGTWYQFKPAALTYTFDDNCSKQLPVALPLFDAYNFKVSFCTVINWSPNWAGLLNASKNGHEISSHTITHPTSLATMSLPVQDNELSQSQSTINTNITNAKCVTVAYPNCNIGDIPTIQKYYIAGRICSNTLMPATPSDFYNISSFIAGTTGSVKLASDFNTKVDAAKTAKGWAVFLIHGIDDDGGYSPTQSSEIKTHLAYVNANLPNFWIGTFANVVKYIKERNALSLVETAINPDSLQIKATANLDNTIYNVPVSVRRLVPTGWNNPKVYINNRLITSSILSLNGSSYIQFDVIPDGSVIALANTKTTTTPPPTVAPVSYCAGATASPLTANGTALKWYLALSGGTALSSAPTPSTSTPGVTTYYVTQTLNAVESTPRTALDVTVNALPSATITANGPLTFPAGKNVVLTANSGNGLSYTWHNGQNLIGTSISYSASTSGNYFVEVKNSFGCMSKSPTVIVTVQPMVTGISTIISNEQTIQAYPIPFNTGLTLKTNGPFNYKIADLNGRLVASGSGENELFLETPFENGVYVLTIQADGPVKWFKLIKTN
jgi:hypothetical protein